MTDKNETTVIECSVCESKAISLANRKIDPKTVAYLALIVEKDGEEVQQMPLCGEHWKELLTSILQRL
jgi:hypothetical protein